MTFSSVDRVDHIVVNCTDVERTARWYETVLGMRRETFGDGRTALHFGRHKLNVRRTGDPDWQTATVDAPGSLDLCFITDASPDDVAAHLASLGVTVVIGPVERHGALGAMTSHYCYDPDGNAVEIAHYAAAPERPDVDAR